MVHPVDMSVLPPKGKGPETVTASIRLKKDTLKEIDDIAESEGFSRNELITHAVDRWLEEYRASKTKK